MLSMMVVALVFPGNRVGFIQSCASRYLYNHCVFWGHSLHTMVDYSMYVVVSCKSVCRAIVVVIVVVVLQTVELPILALCELVDPALLVSAYGFALNL